MDSSDGSLLGSYRIVRRLGEGSVGEVYQAVHEVSQQSVALKVLYAWCARDERLVQRFLTVARDLRSLTLPGFVGVCDFGRLPEGNPYLAMEFLDGETLASRLRRKHEFPLMHTLRLGRLAAALVDVAHQKKILCQPFKPETLMILPGAGTQNLESIKILDFQIDQLAARVNRNRMGTVTYTQHETPVLFGDSSGNAAYLPPELCLNSESYSARSDVYSLGIILYQMLAGKVPFESASKGEVMAMHIYTPPAPLSELGRKIPIPVAEFIHLMLAKKSSDRPSMAQVAKELERITAQFS